MRKRILAILLTLFTVFSIVGCSKVTNSISGGYGDFFHDKAAMEKLAADIKEKSGTPTKILEMSMHKDYVSFKRQDPAKPENVDAFEYRKGTWSGPTPVKLVGSGKLEDNVFDFAELNMLAIPDLVKEAEAKAKEQQFENAQISAIQIRREDEKANILIYIKSDRKSARITADHTGKIIEPFKPI